VRHNPINYIIEDDSFSLCDLSLESTSMAATLQLSSFSENASRLGMRIQESFNEALTRDFGSSTAALFDGAEDKLIDVRKQLDSSSDKEKMDALRRLIAVRQVPPLEQVIPPTHHSPIR